MGAASSVENSNLEKFVQPLVWEYKASKEVMEPAAARINMLKFLTEGKFPFSDDQLMLIKNTFESCEKEINALHEEFHKKWKEISEEGGSQFRSSGSSSDQTSSVIDMNSPFGMGLLPPAEGGHLCGGDLMAGPIGMMEAGSNPSDNGDGSEAEEKEATAHVNDFCKKMMFKNKLPEYLHCLYGGHEGIQIGLKMSARKRFLDKYIEDEVSLQKSCDGVEAKSMNVVFECINSFSKDIMPTEEEISTDIVWGVSLGFMKSFLKSHPEIEKENYTTGSVVYNIIIPETADSKETYVKSHLLGKKSDCITDLRRGYRRLAVPPKQARQGVPPDECGLFAFLSHAWSMPFTKLIEIADLAAAVSVANKVTGSSTINDDERDDAAFFWIDVFCKNQHKPAPAMKEFRDSILAPEKCVVAMTPVKAIAVSRIWCLYEIWTASILEGVEIIPTYTEKDYDTLMTPTMEMVKSKSPIDKVYRTLSHSLKDTLNIDVLKAEATRPEDIETIMTMIRETVGVEALNKTIEDVIVAAMFDRLKTRHNLYNTAG